MAMAEKFKSRLFFFFKLALAAAVVWVLFSRGKREVIESLRTFDCRYLIPAFFFTALQIFFSSWRWQLLAAVPGIKLGTGEAFSLTMQGNFFSLVIPGGAIGGDVVKMAVVCKRVPSGNRMEGAFTVLMDRIVGMISLFSLALLLLVPARELLLKVHFGKLPADPVVNTLLMWGLALLCIGGLGASAIIFFHRILFRLPLISFLLEKTRKFTSAPIARLTAATDAYACSWHLLTAMVLMTTVCVHLLAVVPFCFLLWGLGVKFSLFTVVTAVVIGNIAGLIPLFPGGIGIRDLVTVTILSAGAVAAGDAKTAQLLATAIMLVAYLSGGLFFILDSGTKKAKEVLKDGQ
ncbi:MAG: flippase-like domain-containing protein [Lentisphaerae bacterium]|nr:flippase-like domain-containing protein [Lentisphaerota bacterium]